MGGLNRGRDSGRSRGQLLLAGAFILAVALIGLTLVFSASNYTAALASDDGSISQGDDAVDLRKTVRASLGSYLDILNANDTISYSDKKDAFEEVVPDVAAGMNNYSARRGQYVALGSPTFADGTLIKQSTAAGYLNNSGGGNWSVARQVRARNITFSITKISADITKPLRIRFDNTSTGDYWEIKIYKRTSRNKRYVKVNRSGTTLGTCTRPTGGGNMTVDITSATVEGTHCSALEAVQLEGVSDYDVRIVNVDKVSNGKFWLIVDVPEDGGYISPEPKQEDAIYSATVDYEYDSPSVTYETEIEIVPEEL